MKRSLLAYGILALGSLAALGTAAPASSSGDVLGRMIAHTRELRSFTASLHVDVKMKTFPYLSPTLDGTVYHKEPSKDKIAFQAVPLLARSFDKVYPRVPSPSQWNAIYTIAILGDSGGATTFRLVPRKNGRVEHLDARVDDRTATPVSMTWTYKDGGYVTLNQSFTTLQGKYVVKSQSGHVELPRYKADVSASFSNYRLNVPIADSIFRS